MDNFDPTADFLAREQAAMAQLENGGAVGGGFDAFGNNDFGEPVAAAGSDASPQSDTGVWQAGDALASPENQHARSASVNAAPSATNATISTASNNDALSAASPAPSNLSSVAEARPVQIESEAVR